jgi:hypothetical protein
MTDLAGHLAYLRASLAASESAPLSRRAAMLVVMLADAFVDRLSGAAGGDILDARANLAMRSADLALVLDVAALRHDGPRLVVEAVEVPPDDYPTLSTADFMVSLYNDHTVQRLLISMPDGSRQDAHEVLGDAVDALAAQFAVAAKNR